MSEDSADNKIEISGPPKSTQEEKKPEATYQRFGRYLILDHLVDGGMAQICRGRFLGEQANKIVAIKMIQPQYSKDPTFQQMFEDELKVSFGLQHPNIVQIHDYGMYKEQLFNAMEYVHGRNLKEYLDKLKEKKFVFPVQITVYIISQVCQALHYAHTFTDKLSGKPYNIVHRDISPHNIMLTYDGSVKVIDFGIAKADTNKECTQAGTIKGKLSYLAPEYLEGLKLDPRYDEFAVGITIWEMLCMRKLFTAPNDLAVLKQIQACKIPAPSSINPNVPKELDEIVLKALSKDREGRYEDMDKMNRALIKFLYSKFPDFNATDLGYFAKQLYKEDIDSDLAKFVEYGKINLTEYIRDMNSENAGPQAPHKIKGPQQTVLEFDFNEGETFDLGMNVKKKDVKKSGATGLHKLPGASGDDATGTSTPKFKKPMLSSLKKSDATVSKVDVGGTSLPKPAVAPVSPAVPAVVAAPASSAVAPSTPATPATPTPAPKVNKPIPEKTTTSVLKKDATVIGLNIKQLAKKEEASLDASSDKTKVAKKKEAVVASSGASKLKVYAVIVASCLALVFFKKDWIAQTTGISLFGAGAHRDVASGDGSDLQLGKLFISGLDPYMEVYVDGVKKDYPGLGIELPMQKQAKLEVKKEGHESFIKAIQLKEKVLKIEVPGLKAEKSGMLSTTGEGYREGMKMRIKISGRDTVINLPVENFRLPAGSYEAVVIDPVLETEKAVQFEIEESKKFSLQ